MKKETFTEKLIKRTYGISGPLDEHKRREADRIGNQVFIILFYLMIFGWFAITLFMVIRLRIHRRFLAGMISILLCFLLPLLIVTVGFLYIAGNLHNTLMKGNFHAA